MILASYIPTHQKAQQLTLLTGYHLQPMRSSAQQHALRVDTANMTCCLCSSWAIANDLKCRFILPLQNLSSGVQPSPTPLHPSHPSPYIPPPKPALPPAPTDAPFHNLHSSASEVQWRGRMWGGGGGFPKFHLGLLLKLCQDSKVKTECQSYQNQKVSSDTTLYCK